MNTVFILHELFNGYYISLITVLSLSAIIFAILVITNKNPIVSVLFLIGLFFCIACYLISIGIGFIGLSYLLVYVGAISILFLFILMLLNIRTSELVNETKNSIPLVFFVTSIFGVATTVVLPQNSLIQENAQIIENIDGLAIKSHPNWENALIESNHINTIGNIMYSILGILLIIVSLILLLAMVGAIVITIKPKNLNVEFNYSTLKAKLHMNPRLIKKIVNTRDKWLGNSNSKKD